MTPRPSGSPEFSGSLEPSVEAPPTIVSRNSHFTPLDALRGIAAFAVVAFHMRYTESVKDLVAPVYWLARSGHLGVAMFFVISGFCLGASAAASQRKGESTGSFLFRRLRRIYPPLWCSIIFVICLPWLKYGAFKILGRAPQWPEPLFADFGFVDWFGTASLLQVFRFPEMPVDDKFDKINVVYWSLAIEVQFYLVMALLLQFRRWYYPGLVMITSLSVLAAWCPGFEGLRLNTGFFLRYWPMFAAGILVYELRRRDITLQRLISGRQALILSKFLLFVVVSFAVGWIISGRRFTPDVFAMLTAITVWLLILWEDDVIRRNPGRQSFWGRLFWPLSFLGLISYSVYLIHFNLYKIPELILGPQRVAASPILQFAITIVVCLLCYPFYLLCERPFLTSSKSPKVS
ncbi:MAG: acyltransferase [Planctomyces sp.]|nr:acyltransferase [Planctomyces sp.]